jgi:glycosyltransferase involved in cell wall biosynthesis
VILFGHPGGNPNSHHAALAHYEAGRLEAFCVPWMPTPGEISLIQQIPGLKGYGSRLSRRVFEPLLDAPTIQGRIGEWFRLMRRSWLAPNAQEGVSYEANDWLMRTMQRECRRRSVDVVHAYEDCSLWQFEAAKRLGKFCVYDMPIGYYPAWEQVQANLARLHTEWLPPAAISNRYVRREQKLKEMALADLVLAPSTFVQRTIQQFVDKEVVIAPYGVDLEFWTPPLEPRVSSERLQFIYAGQLSLRKGIPLLFEAWRAAGLKDADLTLVGSWQFTQERLKHLPENIRLVGPISSGELRSRYQEADVFVFPSFFEGFGLVLLESMACGLPAIATEATAGPDILSDDAGRVIPTGNLDALVEALRWFTANRSRLQEMRQAARARAEACHWKNYRNAVDAAVARFN